VTTLLKQAEDKKMDEYGYGPVGKLMCSALFVALFFALHYATKLSNEVNRLRDKKREGLKNKCL